MNHLTYAAVKMTCNELTDDELVALFMAVASGFSNLQPVNGYEKAKHLFTEANGTQMHADTLAALERIVDERL